MRSLGVRLALWYGAAVAVLLVLLGAFLYAGLSRFLTNESLTLLYSEAAPLQRYADTQIHSAADFVRVANQLVERPTASGVGVFVLGPRATAVARSRAAGNLGVPAALLEQFHGVDRGKSEATVVVRSNGQRYLLLYRPLTSGGRLIGALLLATSLQSADRTLNGFLFILLAGIGATLIIAGAIVILLTRVGFRPLRQVVETSEKIAEGDFTRRVDASDAPEEIAQLGTAFNHMAERLQESFQAQRQFVADASHELRTPLTSLAGYIDVLRKGAKDEPATLDRVLATMRSEVQRMSRLVGDLVALARLDAGDELQLRQVDLTRLVEDVYEQSKAMAPGREINLKASEGIWLEADVDRLRQVLLNLADNALKYTPPEAHVNFAVHSYDSTAVVAVADNGPGIAWQERERLFDRFYRAEHSRSREKGGAGLGLAIAKKIVEAHHGTISLTSPDEGGTVFSIRLPLQQPA